MKNFKFKIRGHEYEVDILKVEGKEVEIEVNGTQYLVEMEQEVKRVSTPKLVRSNLPAPPNNAKNIQKQTNGNVTKVLAPLPGNIIQLMVKEGDEISKGAKLLIMEAMKMENDVLAEKDGIVKSVKVNAGDTVLQGDVLIEIA